MTSEEDLAAKKILSSNIFYRKSKIFDEDGLFSEKIFGPLKNYKCKCGKLNSEILDSGKRCEKCKVLCESNNLRFETFGIVDLPFLCLKPTKLQEEIRQVVLNINSYMKTLFEPTRTDFNVSQCRYVGVNKKTGEINIFDNRNDKGQLYIPLRVTGIYSFILCLKYIAKNFTGFQRVQDLFDKQYIMSYLRIIPPGIRPVSYGKSSKIQLSEINKSYISIINLNKSNSLIVDNIDIDEDDWFDRLTLFFQGDYDSTDEEIVDTTIIEYDMITARYQFYINQVYADLLSTISGKEGFIRHNMLGKTIEFSARSVVVCDPSLEPYQIGVSKKILYKLWMLYFLYWLVQIKNTNADWCYENVTKKEYDDNRQLFDEFIEWMGDHE